MPAIARNLTNDEIMQEFGSRIRAKRLERNMTLEDAARETGLNRKTWADLESGRDIRLSTVVKALRALNMLGVLEAALPDTLPGAEAFSTKGTLRQRARSR